MLEIDNESRYEYFDKGTTFNVASRYNSSSIHMKCCLEKTLAGEEFKGMKGHLCANLRLLDLASGSMDDEARIFGEESRALTLMSDIYVQLDPKLREGSVFVGGYSIPTDRDYLKEKIKRAEELTKRFIETGEIDPDLREEYIELTKFYEILYEISVRESTGVMFSDSSSGDETATAFSDSGFGEL